SRFLLSSCRVPFCTSRTSLMEICPRASSRAGVLLFTLALVVGRLSATGLRIAAVTRGVMFRAGIAVRAAALDTAVRAAALDTTVRAAALDTTARAAALDTARAAALGVTVFTALS